MAGNLHGRSRLSLHLRFVQHVEDAARCIWEVGTTGLKKTLIAPRVPLVS